MSAAPFNATLQNIPFADFWSGYVAQAHEMSTARLALLGAVNIPILIIVLNVLWQLLPKSSSTPPVVFHYLPFIGSAITYGNDPVNFFITCREKYGDLFTFILFGRRVTVALGPKGNNFVLGGKSTIFNAEDAYKHLTTPVFGHDVVYDVPNEKFMEQKKFVKIGLGTENLRVYVGMVEEETEEFFKNDPTFSAYQSNDINEWGSFDVLQTLGEITILTASRTLQGAEVRENLHKGFAEIYSDLDGGFTPINFLFPNLPLENYRKRDVAQAKISKFYTDIIAKRRETSTVKNDMMGSLMGNKYRNGTPVKDHEVAHMLIALLMAGQHTSSATGSWALAHLAASPEVAESLYQEQVKHFGTSDGKFRSLTWDELRELPLMDAVIRETLRVNPPIHSIMRYVRDDVAVPPTFAAPSKDGTYVVPKGHYVLASPAFGGIDPRVWVNSEKWDPARWYDTEGVAAKALKDYQDENGEKIDYGFGAVSKGTDSPYQPFGAGRHRCIGEHFAYMQLGTVLSTFIRHFELKMPAGVPNPNYHSMVTLPSTPRTIFYRRRKTD